MPRSRNTRIRPKNTSRAEARRRHREEQRDVEVEPIEFEEAAEAAPTPTRGSMFAMPNVVDDIKALPMVFRKPLVWLPFGLLTATFVLSIALINGAFDEMPEMVVNGISLYINLTLHPTSLFIFFIGGFVAPRASYLVGGILGLLSATVWTVVMTLAHRHHAGAVRGDAPDDHG